MKLNRIFLLACYSLFCSLSRLLAANPLIPQQPVEITGTQGKFDFIKIDSPHKRLLACHTANGSLDVIDVTSSKLIKSIPIGAAQGVAIDEKGGRYFVSVSKPPKMIVVDSNNLEVIGEVPLPSPADILAFHVGSNRVFVCNDEKPELWIIDPEAKIIVSTLTLPGAGMEDLGFDPQDKYLFQALKDANQLAKIDPIVGKVIATWSTAPAEKPHGIAILPGGDSVLVVGGNGKLVLMSLTTGQVLSSADVAQRVDEIAYDSGLQRVYCASGTGTISVVGVDQNKLTSHAPLNCSPGAHSIAVDAQTHAVWIVFVRNAKAYMQTFSMDKNISSTVNRSRDLTSMHTSPIIVSRSKTPTLRSSNIRLDSSTGQLHGMVYLNHGYEAPRLPHVHVYGLDSTGKILFSGCAQLSDESLHLRPRTNLNPRASFVIGFPSSFSKFSEIKVVTDSEDQCGDHSNSI